MGAGQLVTQQRRRLGRSRFVVEDQRVLLTPPRMGFAAPQPGPNPGSATFLARWPSPGLTSCHCRMAFMSRNCWLRWMSCEVTSSREAWHGDALPTTGRWLIPTLHTAGRTGTDTSLKRTYKRQTHERRSTSLIIRETQMKTTRKYHVMLVRTLRRKKERQVLAGMRSKGKPGALLAGGWRAGWCSRCG